MKNEKVIIIDELAQRVYNDIADQQISGLLSEWKPLWNVIEISEHISKNLDKYLTAEEQTRIFHYRLMHNHEEVFIPVSLNSAILIAALDVLKTIENAVTNKDFVGDNPVSPLSNPKAFMLHKFFKEEFGVKLSIIDGDKLRNEIL